MAYGGGSSIIDVEIEEPINSQQYRNPEFFYPNVFVKIKEAGSKTLTTTNVSSLVFHGTHLDEVLDICEGNNAIFRGNMKQWRLLDHDAYNEEYCSYLVKLGHQPVPMTPYNNIPFGPFAWFGTKKEETDKYGPCQFEFNFKSVLRAYQTCRKSQYEICYRAAGTLVYKQEVCHIVMICCREDKEYQNYPLVTENNTCYFKPPNSSSNIEPSEDLQFEIKFNVYQKRHEHLTFALYLPGNRQLYLGNRDGKIRLTPHNTYCIVSRNRECWFREDQLPITIDKLKIITRWISNEGHEEEEEAVVPKYKPLDQSLEDSFNWLSSADEIEYYGDEGDDYNWDEFKEYDQLDFDDTSASDSTILYDSSTNCSSTTSEDHG